MPIPDIPIAEPVDFNSSVREVDGANAVALDMNGVWFGYDPAHPVLKGINLQARSGQVLMVVGISGGGKTTLMKLAKGLLTPQRGSVQVLGQPLETSITGKLNPHVAYIPQQLGLVRNLSAMDNVLTGSLAHVGALRSCLGLFPAELRAEAQAVLESLGIGQKAQEKVYALSGGERQRVAIARALMQHPRLLLADEFVSQLDPRRQSTLMEIMRSLAATGLALIVTTHNLELVSRYADRVMVLRDGEVVLNAAPREADIEALSREME